MNVPSNKNLLAVSRNSASNCHLSSTNSKGFSTINTEFMGNVVRKIVSVILPDAHNQNVSKNRQTISAPDILVDINLSTPIFDDIPGITKLRIPEEEESTTNDQIKFMSNKNSPFDWYPIAVALENESYSTETDTYRKKQNERKQTKKSYSPKCPLMTDPKTYLNTQQKSIVPGYICKNSKSGNKNLKQKNRRIRLVDMMEDIRYISDESESDMNVVDLFPTQKGVQQIYNITGSVQTSLRMGTARKSNLDKSSLPFSDKAIWQPTDQRTFLEYESIGEDDDDSFVIFSEDVQQITPATNSRRNSICAEINNFLASGGRALRRQRQISECSDDSIVFCDSVAASVEKLQDSDSEEIENSDICDDESAVASVKYQLNSSFVNIDEKSDVCNEDVASLSLQLDSGFEEKKVRFNPVPEVHVMRMWNFAYRQARKSCWEMAARDRERFKKRIEETERVLVAIFEQTRREHIFRERFSS